MDKKKKISTKELLEFMIAHNGDCSGANQDASYSYSFHICSLCPLNKKDSDGMWISCVEKAIRNLGSVSVFDDYDAIDAEIQRMAKDALADIYIEEMLQDEELDEETT